MTTMKIMIKKMMIMIRKLTLADSYMASLQTINETFAANLDRIIDKLEASHDRLAAS